MKPTIDGDCRMKRVRTHATTGVIYLDKFICDDCWERIGNMTQQEIMRYLK